MSRYNDRTAADKHSGRKIADHEGLDDLPVFTVISDNDGDLYIKMSGGDWTEVTADDAAPSRELQGYRPFKVISEEKPAPATESDLIRLARKVVNAYNDNETDAMFDAVLSLSVELSTLEES